MNNTNASEQSTANEQIYSSTIVAIISIVLAAGWIAFAYYKGVGGKNATGSNILLLHPIVPIFLIVLLSYIRHLIVIKRVVNILIVMIAIWLFINLLGVFMPFIFGFGLAYFFRFLLNTIQDIPLPKGKRLQLSRGYARGVLIAMTLGAFAILSLYILPHIGEQSQEMSKGLVRFYHQSIIPFVVGNEFNAVAIHPNNPDEIYLGTQHGVYRYERSKDKQEDITSGDLIGQSIQAITTGFGGKYQLYVATDRGLYACANLSQKGKSQKNWKQIGGEIFAGQSVQAIVISSWEPYQLYVGTNVGLYRSDDSGMEWRQINLEMLKENPSPESSMEVFLETSLPQLSIQDIACSSVAARTIYIASNQSVYQSTDDGKTWSLMSLESPEEQLINALTVVTFNGNEQLYAGTSIGVYQWQSQTGWKKISAPAELTNSSSVLLRASLSQQQIFYAGNNTQLYRSTGADTRWEVITQAEKGMLFELEKHPAFGGREVVNRVQEYLTTKLPTLAQTGSAFVGTLVKRFASIALGFGGFLATAFLALIVFIYASQSLNSYVQRLINLFPQDNRDTIKLYLTEIDKNLQSFLRGQVAVILIIGIISIAVYSIIGVPFALVVGLLAGVCNAIPTIGPFIGGAFAMLSLLMGFAAGNFEAAAFLIRIVALLGAILGIQAIDNSFISPKVMSSAVNVDPLLIMLGVIVGASVLGFWGVLLAIPIIVVIKSVLTVSKAIRT